MTHSLFLNFIYAIYKKLNGWYEQSFSYKLMAGIGARLKKSFILTAVYSFFCVESKISYFEESCILRLVGFITGKLSDMLKWLYKVLHVENSLTARIIRGSVLNHKGRFFEHSVCLFIFVAMIVPHSFWSNGYLLLGATGLLAIYAVQVAAGFRKSFRFKDIPAAVIVFTFIAALSLFTGFGGGDGIRIFSFLLSCVVIAVLVQAAITSIENLRLIVFALAAAVLFTALYGMYRLHMGIEIRLEFIDTAMSMGAARLYSTMDNPNNYAEFLIMILPIIIGAVFSLKSDFLRLVIVGSAAVGLLALVLTSSRSAYLSAVIGAAFFVLLANKRLVPFFMVLGILGIPFIPEQIVARVMTIGRDTSSIFRIWIWEGSMEVIRRFWLFGIGMGPVAFALVYRSVAHELAMTAMHSHNLFMQIWIELGIFGIIAFVVLMFTTIKGAAVTAINTKSIELKYYAIGAASGLIAVLAMGFVEYIWFYPRVMLTFWIVIGVCAGAKCIRIRECENK
ncbi:MAG: O-antigen ligase family protein [Defluviitaleaceae bacterium]|nr:O-antigen ligase family protein [Defluviitaleaceae bacterium]